MLCRFSPRRVVKKEVRKGEIMKGFRKVTRLAELSNSSGFPGFEPFQYGDPERNGRVQGSIQKCGLSVVLGHLMLDNSPNSRKNFGMLRSRAEHLTRKIDYLNEPLEIIDHNKRCMFIQIRSLPPYKDDFQIQFNDICITRTKVILKRIAFCRKSLDKQQIPLPLTEDVIDRLVEDFREIFEPFPLIK